MGINPWTSLSASPLGEHFGALNFRRKRRLNDDCGSAFGVGDPMTSTPVPIAKEKVFDLELQSNILFDEKYVPTTT
jgi:hypothetical protein